MNFKEPLWTSAELVATCGGAGAQPWYADGIQIDSREVLPGDLFVALPGAKQNGHDFVAEAFSKGAVAAIVSEEVPGKDIPTLKLVHVPDTMEALRLMAAQARLRAPVKTIAVTGSAGKTSVVQALRQALERTDATHASIKSFNNHVGVPLSLARMPRQARFGVFEVGMSGPGEVRDGARLVKPDVAVVTTVGAAHAGKFNRLGEIAKAKAEIFEGLKSSGVAIIGVDHDWAGDLIDAVKMSGHDRVTVSVTGEANVRPLRITEHGNCTCLTADIAGTTITYKIGQPGREWVLNSLLVLAAVKAVDGDLGHAALALAKLEAEPGRGRQYLLNLPHATATLIDDSYNANPLSLRAGLRRLSLTPVKGFGRRIAVLADMRELGANSSALHMKLADDLKRFGVDKVIAFGPQMNEAGKTAGISTERWHKDADSALRLAEALRSGDVVMVKGANSAGLGDIVQGLLRISADERADDAEDKLGVSYAL